jgi:hypothetical protein
MTLNNLDPMNTAPTDDMINKIVDGVKSTYGLLLNSVSYIKKSTERDVEHRMYEQATLDSAIYANGHMVTAKPFRQHKFKGGGGRFELLEYALTIVKVDGFFAEFGVYKGDTLSLIATRIDQVVYGFDSFEGFPGDWFLNVDKGYFSLQGELPELNIPQQNFRLVKGWFNETLPDFKSQIDEKVAFIHIDCDIYEITKSIFDGIGDRIQPGTVIVFDEYFNYPGWQNHEFKAFKEFCQERNVTYKYLGFAPAMFSVAVVIESLDS